MFAAATLHLHMLRQNQPEVVPETVNKDNTDLDLTFGLWRRHASARLLELGGKPPPGQAKLLGACGSKIPKSPIPRIPDH